MIDFIDCGSCLYPQIDVRDMVKVLDDESELNQRIYTFPTSAIVDSEKKKSSTTAWRCA